MQVSAAQPGCWEEQEGDSQVYWRWKEEFPKNQVQNSFQKATALIETKVETRMHLQSHNQEWEISI